jgi:hypothetical protein
MVATSTGEAAATERGDGEGVVLDLAVSCIAVAGEVGDGGGVFALGFFARVFFLVIGRGFAGFAGIRGGCDYGFDFFLKVFGMGSSDFVDGIGTTFSSMVSQSPIPTVVRSFLSA